MASVGKLFVEIGGDTKGLENAAKQIDKTLAGINTKLKQASTQAQIAFTAISVATIAAGKTAIDIASDYEELQNVTQQSFGESTKSIIEWSKTTGDAIGRSTKEVQTFVSNSKAFLNGFQLAEKESENMSKSLTQLAFDMGSFWNVADIEAFNALRSAISGELEPMKRFGIVMTQAALDQFALQEGLSKTVSEMTEAEKAQLRYNFILSRTEQVQGDLIRTQDSYANQVKRLKANTEELQLEIGNKLLPVMNNILTSINQIDFKQLLSDENIQDAKEMALGLTTIIGAIAGVGTAFALISNPLVALVGTSALVVRGMKGNFEEFGKVADWLSEKFNNLFKNIRGELKLIEIEKLRQQQDSLSTFLNSLNTGVFQTVKEIENVIDSVEFTEIANNLGISVNEIKKHLEEAEEKNKTVWANGETLVLDYAKTIKSSLVKAMIEADDKILKVNESITEIGELGLKENVEVFGKVVINEMTTMLKDLGKLTDNEIKKVLDKFNTKLKKEINKTIDLSTNIKTNNIEETTSSLAKLEETSFDLISEFKNLTAVVKQTTQAKEQENRTGLIGAPKPTITTFKPEKTQQIISEKYGDKTKLEVISAFDEAFKQVTEKGSGLEKAFEGIALGEELIKKLREEGKKLSDERLENIRELQRTIEDTLNIGVENLSNSISSAFNSANLDDFYANVKNELNKKVQEGLIQAIMLKESGLFQGLSELLVKSLEDAKITGLEKSNIETQVNKISDVMGVYYKTIEELDLGFNKLNNTTNKVNNSISNLPTGIDLTKRIFDVNRGIESQRLEQINFNIQSNNPLEVANEVQNVLKTLRKKKVTSRISNAGTTFEQMDLPTI